VGRIKAVDEGLKKQSLVHEVDTAQTLVSGDHSFSAGREF